MLVFVTKEYTYSLAPVHIATAHMQILLLESKILKKNLNSYNERNCRKNVIWKIAILTWCGHKYTLNLYINTLYIYQL